MNAYNAALNLVSLSLVVTAFAIIAPTIIAAVCKKYTAVKRIDANPGR